MDYNEVKELIGIVDGSSLRQFQLKMDNAELLMSKLDVPVSMGKQESVPAAAPPAAPGVLGTGAPVPSSQSVNVSVGADASVGVAKDSTPAEGEIVKAPIVGTYYEAPGIGKPAFVKVGSQVKEGDILCILEAMKIMNEIVSPCNGQVAEIYVQNEALVEYGQPLFRILP